MLQDPFLGVSYLPVLDGIVYSLVEMVKLLVLELKESTINT